MWYARSVVGECLCRVTFIDIKGGGHVVEVRASSLFEAVAQAVRIKGGPIATDDSGRSRCLFVNQSKNTR
jgi:hypothetical protein